MTLLFVQLQEMDFSHNTFGQTGSVHLANWFNQQDSGIHLKYLYLCNTKLDIALVIKAMKNASLNNLLELDLSYNKIDQIAGQALANFLKTAPSLNALNLEGCSLAGELKVFLHGSQYFLALNAVAIVQAISSNEAFQEFRLNISNNELGPAGNGKFSHCKKGPSLTLFFHFRSTWHSRNSRNEC